VEQVEQVVLLVSSAVLVLVLVLEATQPLGLDPVLQ
jgi:hypothetical protein